MGTTKKLFFRYRPGQVVYLVTDTQHIPRQVTGYYVGVDNVIKYELLKAGGAPSFHFHFEISKDKL
jgi:hypothetical protein